MRETVLKLHTVSAEVGLSFNETPINIYIDRWIWI